MKFKTEFYVSGRNKSWSLTRVVAVRSSTVTEYGGSFF